MVRILKRQADIELSRIRLREKGCDTSTGWRRALFETLYRIRYRAPAPAVALNKSWDILSILETIESYLPRRNARILDMGSFNSEIALALWQAGYRELIAVDLNPAGQSIRWFGNRIDFRCENLYHPSVPPESLDAVTAVSVIEHGYDRNRLVDTLKSLLKPGGIALITTDFSFEKCHIEPEFRLCPVRSPRRLAFTNSRSHGQVP